MTDTNSPPGSQWTPDNVARAILKVAVGFAIIAVVLAFALHTRVHWNDAKVRESMKTDRFEKYFRPTPSQPVSPGTSRY